MGPGSVLRGKSVLESARPQGLFGNSRYNPSLLEWDVEVPMQSTMADPAYLRPHTWNYYENVKACRQRTWSVRWHDIAVTAVPRYHHGRVTTDGFLRIWRCDNWLLILWRISSQKVCDKASFSPSAKSWAPGFPDVVALVITYDMRYLRGRAWLPWKCKSAWWDKAVV